MSTAACCHFRGKAALESVGSAELRTLGGTGRPEGWTLTEEEAEVRLWVRRVWVRPLRLLRRHTGETSALQGVQDCSILERKNWKPRDLIPVVYSWEPHDPFGQEQLVQALREESGSPGVQRDREAGSSAPSVVSPSSQPSTGCSRDGAMSHMHSPGFGGSSHFTQKPDCEVNDHRHDIMFPRAALPHFPGQ